MAKVLVPTHRLKNDIPELRLTAGTLVRQVNPFADGKWDHRMCYTQDDYDSGVKQPWIFLLCELEPLETWPQIRQAMIEKICGRK